MLLHIVLRLRILLRIILLLVILLVILLLLLSIQLPHLVRVKLLLHPMRLVMLQHAAPASSQVLAELQALAVLLERAGQQTPLFMNVLLPQGRRLK
ncbi:MAG TPA: hypothetical protein DEQ56_04255 [Bacteroidetes bacterium]|nr:hypothetical protein [Bacteroidota bacterium]